MLLVFNKGGVQKKKKLGRRWLTSVGGKKIGRTFNSNSMSRGFITKIKGCFSLCKVYYMKDKHGTGY